MALAKVDVATYLAAQGVGTLHTDIFIGDMPDQPSKAIAVQGFAGLSGSIRDGSGIPQMQQPAVQVLTRGATNNQKEADDFAVSAWSVLHLRQTEMNGTEYLWCYPIEDEPIVREKDADGRYLVVFNLNMRRGNPDV